MPNLEEAITIGRGPAQVWANISRAENRPTFDNQLIGVAQRTPTQTVTDHATNPMARMVVG